MMKTRKLAPRLTRWALCLQEFDFEVIYKSGRIHKDVDCLSRNPVGDPIEAKDVTERTLVVNVETLTSEEIRERQLRDPKISKIMRLLPKYEHLSCRDRKKLKKFHINEQGLLYRKVENHSADKLCIVIPRCLRKDLYSMHDDPLSGHLGQKKTFERINSRFYFPGMRKYINRYVKTCVECQTRKFPTVPPAGLLQPIIVGGVCEKFGLDILGPFPKSLRDNKYIIVGTEYLTRFAIVRALPDSTAALIASFVVENIICQFGSPREFLTDRGVQFRSAVMKETFNLLHTKH
ncbi:hypothetical protein B4U79_19258, partial [Dinothrombium tinctorium]